MRNRKYTIRFTPLQILAACALAGCAATFPSGSVTPIRADPAAVVEIADIVSMAATRLPAQAPEILRQSLQTALRENGILAGGVVPPESRYLLTLTVRDAGQGEPKTLRDLSAAPLEFEVAATLVTSPGKAAAGTFTFTRALFPATTGDPPWESFLAEIAAEAAAELRIRLRGEGQIVRLPSLSDREDRSEASLSPFKVRLFAIEDGRREKRRVGYREQLGAVAGEPLIADRRQVTAFFLEAIRSGFVSSGHTIVDNGEDLRVAGLLRLFWLWTEQTPHYAEIFAEIEFVLELIDPASGRSRAIPIVVRKEERTYVVPSAAV